MARATDAVKCAAWLPTACRCGLLLQDVSRCPCCLLPEILRPASALYSTLLGWPLVCFWAMPIRQLLRDCRLLWLLLRMRHSRHISFWWPSTSTVSRPGIELVQACIILIRPFALPACAERR